MVASEEKANKELSQNKENSKNIDSEYLAAQLIACPVAMICAQDLEHGTQGSVSTVDHAMISSVSYANLKPLILSTALLHTSTTGSAIVKSQKLSVSLLSYSQLVQVETFSKSQSQTPAESRLKTAGFSLKRFSSGIIYIENCMVAIDLHLVHSTGLEGYTLVLAQASEMVFGSADKEPLIRYNRLYQTIDKNKFGQSKDDYPV